MSVLNYVVNAAKFESPKVQIAKMMIYRNADEIPPNIIELDTVVWGGISSVRVVGGFKTLQGSVETALDTLSMLATLSLPPENIYESKRIKLGEQIRGMVENEQTYTQQRKMIDKIKLDTPHSSQRKNEAYNFRVNIEKRVKGMDPIDRHLYLEILYDRVNAKLTKVKLEIKRLRSEDKKIKKAIKKATK